MSNFTRTSSILLITAVGLFLLINFAPAIAYPQGVTVPSAPIAEANDYATLVWGDPWDMSEYSDVSQYMNGSGELDIVRNINVDNGVFSGASADYGGWFFTLFPGYRTAIHAGKAGSFRPISSSQYNCLHIAMKVDTSVAYDQYRVYWYADDLLYTNFGATNGQSLTPYVWKLYKVDLTQESAYTAWDSKPAWQGLRIEPTYKSDVNFSVDWVRLTNSCSPSSTTNITFSPDNSITSAWLRPEGTTRHIQVATNVNGSSGSYNLDTQGFQPGKYYVGFGNGNSCCDPGNESADPITINQTPIVEFTNPTFYSGQDYATTAGNAWDMSSSDDYTNVTCASYGLGSGALWLDTPSNMAQPPECVGGPPELVADPTILLNTPTPANPAEYRYLTFRSYEGNPWQYVAKGSITRWIWVVQGSSGLPGHECYLVSNDIPHDVGWHTYTVDLWDTFAGSAEGKAGECTNLPLNWQQSSPVLRMRFDPNENITDHTFRNEIDWVRLTKPIVISQGKIYDLGLNKYFSNDMFDVNLFYTTDPQNQPTQHPVILYTSPTPSSSGPFTIFLPNIMSGMEDPMLTGADLEYRWDTDSVTPGEYFICAQVSDDYNQAVFCSEATITVTP